MAKKLTEAVYTPKELAQLIQRPISTLADWRHHNYGPKYTKHGRLVRYPVEEVNAWLKDPEAYQDDRQLSGWTMS